MSEINATPEELVEEVSFEVDDANVIPIPIDPTLTHPGEAADAKAVGDAIRQIGSAVRVNNVSADETGNIALYPANIPMSGEQGAQTLAQVVTEIQGRTANDIVYNSETGETIGEALDDTVAITTAEIDEMMEDWEDGEA